MEETQSFIFKVEFDGDLRRFVLASLNFQTLEEKSREIFIFSAEQQISFRHLDADGDMVAVTSDAKLNEIHSACMTSPKIIRLSVDVTTFALPETTQPITISSAALITKPEIESFPENEAAEPEVRTPSPEPVHSSSSSSSAASSSAASSSSSSSSSSSVPPKKLSVFEKKKLTLSRLSATRSRLTQRHEHLIEQCDRIEQKATVVAGRLDNVDRRIVSILNKYPEMAASFPELNLEDVPESVEDRSRSNLFCDSCDIGILAHSEVHFHCDICGNFDLCVRCERQFGHEHDLLRIEQGTRRLPSFFDLSFDNEVRTLEACCLDIWHELEASGLICPRNLAILLVITLVSLVMALSTAYAVCSALFSVVH